MNEDFFARILLSHLMPERATEVRQMIRARGIVRTAQHIFGRDLTCATINERTVNQIVEDSEQLGWKIITPMSDAWPQSIDSLLDRSPVALWKHTERQLPDSPLLAWHGVAQMGEVGEDHRDFIRRAAIAGLATVIAETPGVGEVLRTVLDGQGSAVLVRAGGAGTHHPTAGIEEMSAPSIIQITELPPEFPVTPAGIKRARELAVGLSAAMVVLDLDDAAALPLDVQCARELRKFIVAVVGSQTAVSPSFTAQIVQRGLAEIFVDFPTLSEQMALRLSPPKRDGIGQTALAFPNGLKLRQSRARL